MAAERKNECDRLTHLQSAGGAGMETGMKSGARRSAMTITDTLRDLANYAIMTLLEMEG